MGNVANVQIRPYLCKWGVDTAQVSTILVQPDIGGSLNNKYFYLYDALNAHKYYVWFNINSAGADPVPGGATACPVTGATSVDAATLAQSILTAVNALNGTASFQVTRSGNLLTITNKVIGYASQPHDSKASSQTGFSFACTTQGITAADVGMVEGDIDWKPNEKLLNIIAHESGDNIRGQLRIGREDSITLNFLETSPAQLRKVLEQANISMLPEGAGTTEVVGMGNAKQFGNTFAQATQLVLHPNYLPSTDHSQDFTFWLAYPKLNDMKLSGVKAQILPLTFTLFPDYARKLGFEVGVYGDATQTLT